MNFWIEVMRVLLVDVFGMDLNLGSCLIIWLGISMCDSFVVDGGGGGCS